MQKLVDRFTVMVEDAQRNIDAFVADMAKDPAHALQWGYSAFEAAGKLAIAKMVISALTESDFTVQRTRDMLMERVMHHARNPARSTSPTANIVEQCETAAAAVAVQMIDSHQCKL